MPSHYDNLELCRYLNLQWINNPMSPKPQICHGAGTARQTVICGPWWGRGNAGDLDLGMHWWLVRNDCVQWEIWKGFLYVAPIFRCVTGNHSQNFVFLDFEGLGHSGNGWLICCHENAGCDLGWLAFWATFDLWPPGSLSITVNIILYSTIAICGNCLQVCISVLECLVSNL